MKKKPRRKQSSQARPSPKARLLGSRAQHPKGRPPGMLEYRVVELSTVDESSLEDTVNQHVRQGWVLEGVQFAMRESSKRPSMAFVFFTRTAQTFRSRGEAQAQREAALQKLVRLAAEPSPVFDDEPTRLAPVSPYERLRQLAGEEDEGAT